MIRKLFASPALHATLAIFFDYPSDSLFPRLIARYTRTDIKGVLRELRKLEQIGVIGSRRAGKGRRYWLNEEFLLYEEFMSIFEKTRKCRRYANQTTEWGLD